MQSDGYYKQFDLKSRREIWVCRSKRSIEVCNTQCFKYRIVGIYQFENSIQDIGYWANIRDI